MRRYAAAVLAACLCGGWLHAAPIEVPREVKARPGKLVKIVVKEAGELGCIRNFTDDEAFFGELVGTKTEKVYFLQPPEEGYKPAYVLSFYRIGDKEGGAAVTVLVEGTPAKAETAKTLVAPPDVARKVEKTLCLCEKTRKCVCLDTECACPECAKSKAAAPGVPASLPFGRLPPPVAGSSDTTRVTPAPGADAAYSFRPGPVQYAAPTYTLVPTAGRAGITSGCANGQCGRATIFGR